VNLAVIGPPGVGNESRAATLADHFDLLHISSGEQFRGNLVRLTELGMAAQEYMKRGELVPDEPAPDEVAEAMAFRAADTPESVRVRL
jgi:adenylate kinase